MGQTRCLTRITQRIIDSSETDHPSREWKRPFIARITPTHAEYDITLDIKLCLVYSIPRKKIKVLNAVAFLVAEAPF